MSQKYREFWIGVISEWPWQITILQSDYDHSEQELSARGIVRKIRAIEKSALEVTEARESALIEALEDVATSGHTSLCESMKPVRPNYECHVEYASQALEANRKVREG